MNDRKAILVIVMLALATTIGVTPILLQSHTEWFTYKAPLVQVAASGNKVYVVWDSNKTSPLKEILFRASSDNGTTFSDKINLSHSPKGLSELANIAASGNEVYVVWG